MSHKPRWPADVGREYEPVRPIGKGGFAEVWMAKNKTTGGFVAIKCTKEDIYSKREVAILTELSRMQQPHPHLVKLVKAFEPADGAVYIALSLARGPTLHHIIRKHGALGLVIAQVISRQLIGAVAYLHGHGVIFRDCHPSNVVVSGSAVDTEAWWSDSLDLDGEVLALAKRCRVTLIDFGFARALQLDPAQCVASVGIEARDRDDDRVESARAHEQIPTTKRGRTREQNLNKSQSRRLQRGLSAVGTRKYADPSIFRTIRDNLNASMRSMNSSMNRSSASASHKERKLKSFSASIADYSLTADSYSIGCTIRHMVTGVPPGISVPDFIAEKNRPFKAVLNAIKRSKRTRPKMYRELSDLPESLADIISKMTTIDSRKRLTVRTATQHPWIEASFVGADDVMRPEARHGNPIICLECATCS
ncbi:hypothetical protein THAOC_02489 [Thalassiosira oceanica]|uniref:Protein kinase domain-containing protein n=1 Tax=Thalassiosira oceanica TaxID=159749 RepID=K0TQC0_THAOC|nr:hypothetical protein THAOC_02489 [Thalassiosira oceanica]|mmetsp:Transcript_25219/g.59991  ORF Transcript_25219/g.59991 Transcript_25219/m.59991 type:complete len:421 (+) Transcript_25219:205-1467(+)|eukprot:EJK75782.1 hypothetical protein THAOC_02489 [Thalassiosira oceanica]